MNKQITQLDKQAKIWAMENTNYPISTYIPPGYTEKLAELIVQECMAKCAAIEKNFEDNEAPGIGLDFGAERSVANSCRASIADHFGVNLD